MISPELLRRYPFFAGLSHDQIVKLAQAAKEVSADAGHYFFHEGDELENCFFLVLEGSVAVVFEVPDPDVEQSVANQLTGEMKTKDVVISVAGPGEVFAWSGLIPPHQATASSKATTPCRVIAFDRAKLLADFERECNFGYLMVQKVAQISRDRLRDMRIESLSHSIG